MHEDAGVHRGRKFLTDLCIGGTAAVISKTVMAPMERVKLLLQVQNTHAGIASSQRYSGIRDALIRVPNEQGIASFWRGNATNVMRYFPTQALNFAFNDLFRSRLTSEGEKKGSLSYLGRSMAAGGLAGSVTMCFVYPLDVLRTRISVDVGRSRQSREYKLYFLYRSIYFGLYDTARGVYETDNGSEKRKLNFLSSFLLAEGVTAGASYLVYPWDTVRRRMMIMGALSHFTAIETVKAIVRTEGVVGLYKGALANLLRATGSALVMSLYHELQQFVK
ncbi:hypothetical protein PRIPAC_90968 [Pristionchus pacificus]|uniref:ADP/ATP translocase n=1 Tax=Pristionchus pacificus TaxID=54126 RepID=A0A2A6B744_PRIPA|nr:hypothetical protein PRIPAC_90968 [Pristionchus pacificus]|eukprot:PDM61673.1 mitochondrial carrier protein [Pristionchus pacificus]